MARRPKKSTGSFTSTGRGRRRAGDSPGSAPPARDAVELALFRTIFDHASVGIALVDPAGVVVEANAADCRFLGYSQTELVGMHFSLFSHPDDLAVDQELYASLLRGEREAYTIDKRYVRRDGAVVWGRLAVSLLRQADGTIRHTLVVCEDITAAREAQEALRESERRFRELIENVELVAVMLDQQGRIIFANDYLLRLTGWRREEVQGRSWFGLFVPDSEIKELFLTAMASGSFPFHYENPILTRDGSSRLIRWSNSILRDPHGQVVGSASLGEDVTEQRRVDQELRRAQEAAEAASRAKGEFLANMSHEIRTPLNAIIGINALLLESTLDERQRELAQDARNAANSLLQIVNDILDHSKMEAHKLELVAEKFELRPFLESIHRVFAYSMERKGLGFSLDIATGVPDLLVGDPVRLRQVVTNLMNNAVKFTTAGEISLTVATVAVGDVLPAAGSVRLRFQVDDTGIGIPLEKQGMIFEMFSQADASTTRQFGGTGLGLAISRRLVELMGGEIRVASEPGRGSRFSVELPFLLASDQRNRSTRPADGPTTPALAGLRILLAEDHEINRKVAILQLEKWGHRVSIAVNGRQALERLAREPFDLVLMDISMPEMDGLQATREIREGNVPGCPRDIPVVALTAHAMKGDRERILVAGMDGYLAKPIRPEELAKVIRQVLPHGVVASPPPAVIAGTPGDAQLFDRGYQERHFGTDPAFLQELLALYREDLPQKLREIEQCLAVGDRDGIAKVAHTLAGASATVGAVAVRKAAARLSEVPRSAAAADIQEPIVALRTVAELTLARLSDAANEANGGTP